MIELANIALPLDSALPGNESIIRQAAARVLDIKERDIASVRLIKRSVDARKKKDVHFVATLGVELTDSFDEQNLLAQTKSSFVKLHKPYKSLEIPVAKPKAISSSRPVVVGTGPAGLFAALYLVKAGLCPLVIERGQAVEQRLSSVKIFNEGGALDVDSNIQFGEGGAGTFSDGKLTTNTKNPYTAHVLHWFAEAGAPEEILWEAKPHIGTDRLVSIVRNMRKQIVALGGEIRFSTRLTKLHFEEGALSSITTADVLSGQTQEIKVQSLILATGHSARDVFEMLHESSIVLEQKPFSVGVRIEHQQHFIDEVQYGSAAKHPGLGAADYKLAVHLESGRSVYTFCMCPGGEIVCAASEPETVVVNGMSRFARDSSNANSAVLVGVDPADFGSNHPLAGVEFQRRIEKAAYCEAIASGGKPYQAPAQKLGSFLSGISSAPSSKESFEGGVQPSYARGVSWGDLRKCLPDFVVESLVEALPLMNRKLKGFSAEEAVLTGVETRSSSPVRVCRNNYFQASLRKSLSEEEESRFLDSPLTEEPGCGLYPCGEGAGYAGGIMSAAVDGLRVAEALVARY